MQIVMMFAKNHRTRIVISPEIRRFLKPTTEDVATDMPAHMCIGEAIYSQNENRKTKQKTRAFRTGFLKDDKTSTYSSRCVRSMRS